MTLLQKSSKQPLKSMVLYTYLSIMQVTCSSACFVHGADFATSEPQSCLPIPFRFCLCLSAHHDCCITRHTSIFWLDTEFAFLHMSANISMSHSGQEECQLQELLTVGRKQTALQHPHLPLTTRAALATSIADNMPIPVCNLQLQCKCGSDS